MSDMKEKDVLTRTPCETSNRGTDKQKKAKKKKTKHTCRGAMILVCGLTTKNTFTEIASLSDRVGMTLQILGAVSSAGCLHATVLRWQKMIPINERNETQREHAKTNGAGPRTPDHTHFSTNNYYYYYYNYNYNNRNSAGRRTTIHTRHASTT
jgi:hypothetical protein